MAFEDPGIFPAIRCRGELCALSLIVFKSNDFFPEKVYVASQMACDQNLVPCEPIPPFGLYPSVHVQ